MSSQKFHRLKNQEYRLRTLTAVEYEYSFHASYTGIACIGSILSHTIFSVHTPKDHPLKGPAKKTEYLLADKLKHETH